MGPLRDLLVARDVPVLLTREPGGTPLAEAIRSWVLDDAPERPEPLTELLLVFAARRQHWIRVIEPALASGTWVLCDRFVDSTYAYQGAGRGLPADRIATLESWVLGSRQPDLTFFFEAPIALALKRILARGHPNRMEQESIAWHERVQAGYRKRIAAEPNRFIVVQATADRAAISRELCQHLERLLQEWTERSE
ncbi:thymidylate kinase [mine drainage metagenome]|uniref:dTMP kinase n=1 Tax=mine drainage metagenome TaxID=410659 RepID=T1C5L0_9ZZZZ